LNTLGVVYYRLGRYRNATETLERSLHDSGGDTAPFNLFFLAMCHARRHDLGRARQCYDRAVRWTQEHRTKLRPAWLTELDRFRTEAATLLNLNEEPVPLEAAKHRAEK
jgi:Tfp pilus assembly protein PilF